MTRESAMGWRGDNCRDDPRLIRKEFPQASLPSGNVKDRWDKTTNLENG
jgi:hypothetical protein